MNAWRLPMLAMPVSESTDRTHRDVLDEVERAMAVLQQHADPEVREAARALLEGIDAVHRAGLSHMVEALHALAGDTLVNRLVADPAIRMLLMSYGLVAVDRRLQAEEALDVVRGHLHDHGIDVELLDVVGGVVYARVHARGSETPPLEAIRRDLEAALFAGLIGFQELVFRDRHEPAATPLIPVASLRRANRPVYRDVMADAELAPEVLCAVDVAGVPVLVTRVAGEVYAVRNRCGDSPLPLDPGSLAGAELHCPWHGCRFDVRSGHRLDAAGDRLQVFPVAIEDGRIRVALDVEPHEDR